MVAYAWCMLSADINSDCALCAADGLAAISVLSVMCREYSKQLNESRLKVLQAREGSVHNIVKEAHGKLIEYSKDKKQYQSLLTDLTVQVYANPNPSLYPLCV